MYRYGRRIFVGRQLLLEKRKQLLSDLTLSTKTLNTYIGTKQILTYGIITTS